MLSRNLIFVCLFQPVSIEEENLPIRGTTREVSTHIYAVGGYFQF